jgi:hypothetical protein
MGEQIMTPFMRMMIALTFFPATVAVIDEPLAVDDPLSTIDAPTIADEPIISPLSSTYDPLFNSQLESAVEQEAQDRRIGELLSTDDPQEQDRIRADANREADEVNSWGPQFQMDYLAGEEP